MILFDQHIASELYIKKNITKNPKKFTKKYNTDVVSRYYEKNYNNGLIRKIRNSSRCISWCYPPQNNIPQNNISRISYESLDSINSIKSNISSITI